MITAKIVHYSLLNYNKKQPVSWEYMIGPWNINSVPKWLKDDFKSLDLFKQILKIYRYLLKMSDERITRICKDNVIDDNPWTAANLLLDAFPEVEEHDGKLVINWETKKAREMFMVKNFYEYTPWKTEGGV